MANYENLKDHHKMAIHRWLFQDRPSHSTVKCSPGTGKLRCLKRPKYLAARLRLPVKGLWTSFEAVLTISQPLRSWCGATDYASVISSGKLVRYNRKDWHCIEVRSLRLAKSKRNTQHQEPINRLLTTLCHQCVVSRLFPMYGMVWSISGLLLVNLVSRTLFPGFINAVNKTLQGELEYSNTNAYVTYW